MEEWGKIAEKRKVDRSEEEGGIEMIVCMLQSGGMITYRSNPAIWRALNEGR